MRLSYRHPMPLMSTHAKRFLAALPLVVLASCAAPKAVAVADPPKQKSRVEPEVGGGMPASLVSRAPQDKIRLGENFLSMPGDAEFRSTRSPEASSAGAVTVRPPSDPVIPPDIGPKVD
jgi:hypothetical protein